MLLVQYDYALIIIGTYLQTIDKLPDKVLLIIFSYIGHKEVLKAARVSHRWKSLACNPALWQTVSFRPNYGGLQVQ